MRWLVAFFVVVALVIIAFTAPAWAVFASVATLAAVGTYGVKKAIDAYEASSYSITVGKRGGSTDAIEVIESGPLKVIEPNEQGGPVIGPASPEDFKNSYYDSLIRVYQQ